MGKQWCESSLILTGMIFSDIIKLYEMKIAIAVQRCRMIIFQKKILSRKNYIRTAAFSIEKSILLSTTDPTNTKLSQYIIQTSP